MISRGRVLVGLLFCGALAGCPKPQPKLPSHVIVLSLDTFDEDVDMQLLGAKTVKSKLKVLDLLERQDVTTTILPAVAAGPQDSARATSSSRRSLRMSPTV